MLISLVLGVLVGAVLGLTAAGGGILAVPALAVGLGRSMEQAIPVALLAVAGGAGVGALEGFRRKLVRYRAAALMAATGIPLTALGVKAAQAVSQRALLALPPLQRGVEMRRRRTIGRHDKTRNFGAKQGLLTTASMNSSAMQYMNTVAPSASLATHRRTCL